MTRSNTGGDAVGFTVKPVSSSVSRRTAASRCSPGFNQAAGSVHSLQRLLAALDEQQFPVVKDSRADAQQRAFGIAPAGAAPTVHGDFFWLILHPGTGAS